MALLIDSLGAPGSYKSKTMLDLTSLLKSYFSHYLLPTKVEYCPEYVKDAIWEGDSYTIGNQAIVFGEQFRSVERLINSGIDIICSDSALCLSANYSHPDKYPRKAFVDIIKAHYSSLNVTVLPILFYPDEDRHYQQEGRRESKEESDQKHQEIVETAAEVFGWENVVKVTGNNKTVFVIMEHLLEMEYLPIPEKFNKNIRKDVLLRDFIKEYLKENLCNL